MRWVGGGSVPGERPGVGGGRAGGGGTAELFHGMAMTWGPGGVGTIDGVDGAMTLGGGEGGGIAGVTTIGGG